MIKKAFFVVQLLLAVMMVCAQDYSNKIDIIPPSPNAASLGAYGGLTPNLVTGAASVNLPVYSLKVAGHDIGVALGYNSSGFKVDEFTSQVGCGWSLNAGGMISRVIYDIPDERGTRVLPPERISNNNPEFNEFLQQARSDVDYEKNTDAQPDQFSFNFMGYSGKFILDRTLKPVLLEFSNLKIEYTTESAGIDSFKVTAPDGVQYFFTKVEKTKSTPSCGIVHNQSRATAWYLTRMLMTNGEEVTFEYNDLYLTYNSSASETMYSNANPTGGCPGTGCPARTASSCKNYYFSNSYLLAGIYSNSGSIKFEYIDRIDANSGTGLQTSGQLLNKISIFDPGQNYIKSFTLAYQTVACGFVNQWTGTEESNRSFLVKVTENDRNDAGVRSHQFEYNDINDLPARLSYAQDHWGYFNGKNNSSLIPLPRSYNEQVLYPVATANREPDVQYATKGILKKVIYPTGGYEQLEYEPNTVYLNKEIVSASTQLSTYAQGTGRQATVTNSNTISIGYGQEALLTLYVHDLDPTDPYYSEYDPLHHIVEFTVIDNSDGSSLHYQSYGPGTYQRVALSLSAGHSYTITTNAHGQLMKGNALLDYIPGSSYWAYVNENVGGVRVKMTATAADANELPVTKYYYYAALNSLNRSSGAAYTTGNISYIKTVKSRQACEVAGSYAFCTYTALYSNSLLNLFIFPGNIQYSYITESIGGPNFENGGIQHTYTLVQDVASNPIKGEALSGAPFTNSSISSGKEIETLVFNKDQLPVEKRVMEYVDDSAQSRTYQAYAVTLQYELPSITDVVWPEDDELNSYNCTQYQIFSRWIYKSKETVYKYDPTGNAYLTERQEFEYKNPSHALPTQLATYTSTGQKKLTTLQYPLDLVLIPNKTPFQSKFDLDNAIATCEQTYNESINAFNDSLLSLIGQANVINGTCYEQWNGSGCAPCEAAGLNCDGSDCSSYKNDQWYACRTANGYDNIISQINSMVASKNFLATRQTCINNAISQYNQSILDYNNALDQAINNTADEHQEAVLTMQKRTMVNPIIEKREYENTLNTELSSTENKFKVWDANVVEPHYIHTSLKGNTSERIMTFLSYDNKGNLLAFKPRGKANTNVLWGYGNNYPIASTVNAIAGETFFDSFEESGTWNGIVADNTRYHAGRAAAKIENPTGSEQVYHSTKWLNISLSSPKKFHYSGWVYSDGPTADIYLFMKRAGETGSYSYVDNVSATETNKWVYIEKDFEVPADVTQLNIRIDNNGGGNVWFDDIRLHPSSAQMISYTYDPLIGITSQTDTNNRITYYDYDAFGRLKTIKDQDGNIIKTLEYHYKTNQ